jgi:hypothetical protein
MGATSARAHLWIRPTASRARGSEGAVGAAEGVWARSAGPGPAGREGAVGLPVRDRPGNEAFASREARRQARGTSSWATKGRSAAAARPARARDASASSVVAYRRRPPRAIPRRRCGRPRAGPGCRACRPRSAGRGVGRGAGRENRRAPMEFQRSRARGRGARPHRAVDEVFEEAPVLGAAHVRAGAGVAEDDVAEDRLGQRAALAERARAGALVAGECVAQDLQPVPHDDDLGLGDERHRVGSPLVPGVRERRLLWSWSAGSVGLLVLSSSVSWIAARGSPAPF